jgi:hypothetical protein
MASLTPWPHNPHGNSFQNHLYSSSRGAKCRFGNYGEKLGFSLLYIHGAGVDPSPLLLRPFIGLLYQPWMIDRDDCGAISGMNEWQGKLKYWEETCPSAALSTTDPTCRGPGATPGRRCSTPATDLLSYGAAESLPAGAVPPYRCCAICSGRQRRLCERVLLVEKFEGISMVT